MIIKCTIPISVPDTSTNHLRLSNRANISGINKFILKNLQRLVIPLDQNLINDYCDQIEVNLDDIFKCSIDKFEPSTKFTQHRAVLSPITRALQLKSKRLHKKLLSYSPLPLLQITRLIKTRIGLLKNMIFKQCTP